MIHGWVEFSSDRVFCLVCGVPLTLSNKDEPCSEWVKVNAQLSKKIEKRLSDLNIKKTFEVH